MLILYTNARLWPFSATGLSNLRVRYVPKAEVNLGILNVRYRESRHSEFIAQRQLSALCGLLRHPNRERCECLGSTACA